MSDTTRTTPISERDASYHFGWGIAAKVEKLMGTSTCVEAWRQMVTWGDDHPVIVLRLSPRSHARSFQSRTWQMPHDTFANQFPICSLGDGVTKGLGYISLPPEYEFTPVELEYIAVLKGTWEKMTVGELKTKQESLVLQLSGPPVPSGAKAGDDENLRFLGVTKPLTKPDTAHTFRDEAMAGAPKLVENEGTGNKLETKQEAIGQTLQDGYGSAGFHPSYGVAGLHPQDVIQAIVLNRLRASFPPQNSDDKQLKGG
jgi:hypothetical protein